MIVFIDLFLNLSVADFGGTFMEQARANHGDNALGGDLDEFPYEGWVFHQGFGHLGVVVGHGSSGLEEELELTLGGVGIVVEDFSECFLLVCLMACLMASMRLKGFSVSSWFFFRRCSGGSRRIWGVW